MAKAAQKRFHSPALLAASQQALRERKSLRDALTKENSDEAKQDSYELVAVHPHTQSGFVLVGKRRGIQYTLNAGYFPHGIYTAEGRVIVTHTWDGFHRYSQRVNAASRGSEEQPMLDPICEAVLNKGWSLHNIRMGLRLNPKHDVFPMGSCTLRNLQIRRKYTGARVRYGITDVAKASRSIESDPRLNWAIIVDERETQEGHREGKLGVTIFVAVPQIYDEKKSMEALLRAIGTLPHAKGVKGAHLAKVA